MLFRTQWLLSVLLLAPLPSLAAGSSAPFPKDPKQALERTCFQTGSPYRPIIDLRSDVAIVYGIDRRLPARIKSWREHGYRIQVMTGVAWGNYQDYLYGRFDGVNHVDEAQTDRYGHKVSHGGDVYYMCPGENYGKFLCVGVQRALDAGAKAIHLEEPEFWVRSGYSEGFKREWRKFYGENWMPPHESVDAQWRASNLKYYLYRRALQQVFDYVQAYNRRTGHDVHCYVPTHSLINYAQWRIVSPESSLARLHGCDGYIAQVWTGTARTPNMYRGELRQRTFETAFLEYGAMQNLVRSTGRRIWYLNDPVEDNPHHTWSDYRSNWESTLVASLFQPEVWHYEVAPWPERVFGGRYPSSQDPQRRVPIPPPYATELQTVFNALNDMNQHPVKWNCGTSRLGVMVSDSLMFERGQPTPSDPNLSQIYGLALPFLMRGMPITPVQLENLTIPGYLDGFDLILLTYQGMKPLTEAVHPPLAAWVRRGGVLVVCDDDSDPYNHVREWWNTNSYHYATPRQDLFKQLGLGANAQPGLYHVGQGTVLWKRANPAQLAAEKNGDVELAQAVRQAIAGSRVKWHETSYLLLHRGQWIIAAGLDQSPVKAVKHLHGRFIDLFDARLRLRHEISLTPHSRYFLLDLDRVPAGPMKVLLSACKTLPVKVTAHEAQFAVEGPLHTQAVVLLRMPQSPEKVTLAGKPVTQTTYDAPNHLLWVHFTNDAQSRVLDIVSGASAK